MLEIARQRARDSEPSVGFVQSDAQDHDLGSATFDHLVSRFGVMFFPNPVQAFENLRKACSPNGPWPTWFQLEEVEKGPILEAATSASLPYRQGPLLSFQAACWSIDARK